MTRGDAANKRTRDVRVRLTEDEYALWEAAREKSGRKEMGAWVRAAVAEMLTGRRAPRRPGDLGYRVVPEVNIEAYQQLVGIASNVNQLARWCHTERRAADAGELRRLAAELEAVSWAVRGSRRPPAPGGRTGQPSHTPHTVPRQAAAPDVERVDQADADTAGGGRRRWPFRRGSRT